MGKINYRSMYRFRNVIFCLIGISILSYVIGLFVLKVNDTNRYQTELSMQVRETVYNSVSNLTNHQYSRSFPYHVKSYKMKYFDSQGRALNDKEGKSRYEQYEKQKELEKRGLNPSEYQKELLGEIVKKPTVFYMSNDGSKDFDPATMEFPQSDFWIRGHYTNGEVTFDEVKVSDSVKNSDRWYSLERNYKEAIANVYTNSIVPDSVLNIAFAYDLNFNAPYMQNFNNGVYLSSLTVVVIPFTVVLTMVLTALYTLLLNYKKLKEFNERIWAFELPLEIICILFFLFLFCGFAGLDLFESSAALSFFKIKGVLLFITGICIVIGNFIFALCTFDGVMFLKSVHYEKWDNYLFRNSVIIQGVKHLFHGITTDIGATEDEETMKQAKRRVFVALLVLFILGFIYFKITSRIAFLTILIYVGVLCFIYYCISCLLHELLKINRSSSEIVKGNYDAKVESSFPVTKKIADNFNSISNNLNTAVENAVKSERMKSELVTNVSHDLKTPLTSIINYSDLLQKENVTVEEQREYAQIIYDKSQKLKTLIEDLFEVSKASSKNIDLNLEELDFRALLLQVMGEWEDKLEEKGITLVANLEEGPMILNLDGSKTSRILDNLFTNLNKYTMEHSRVYVDLKNTNGHVFLEIKNMSKYALNITPDELMQRFTRGDVSRNTEGSGLGLSIAKSLVEVQGGVFDIEIDGDLFKSKIIF